jgi:hypothetical protein
VDRFDGRGTGVVVQPAGRRRRGRPAKVKPWSRAGVEYPTYSIPSDGATEIDLIEVRQDLRGTGHHYGCAAVNCLVEAFGTPAIAMSLDEDSDGFWRALGWQEHVHEEADGHRRLFTLRLP